MKKNYLDLTLLEFLDAITNRKAIYYFDILTNDKISKINDSEVVFKCNIEAIDGDKIRLTGTKEDILWDLKRLKIKLLTKDKKDIHKSSIENLDRVINKDFFNDVDCFDKELNDIEIYNYLDHITHSFDIERIKIILWDIDVYYNLEFLEWINEESMKEYLKNKWDIPQEIVRLGTSELTVPDYKKMRVKTHGYGFSWRINWAIGMLKQKLKEAEQPIQTSNKQNYKIPDEILLSLEQQKCIALNPLQWLKPKALFAYFVVGMCETYNLKHGQNRTLKPFENRFNIKGLSGTINDIKKVGTPPSDYKIINDILKLPKTFFEDIFLNDK
jgi:hypothetical protein